MTIKKWQVSLSIAFLALGILLSLQFRTQQVMVNDLKMQKTEDLLALVKKLYERRSELLQEIWALRGQQRVFEADQAQGKIISQEMEKELTKLQIASGAVPVEGPGIMIIIPPKTDTQYYYYEDIAFLVNELFNVGAEAVAINNHRITSTTAIYEESGTQKITIDGQVLTGPIEIKAIGDPATLQNGISISGGFLDRLQLEFGVTLAIEEAEKLQLPAAKKTNPFRFAQEVRG